MGYIMYVCPACRSYFKTPGGDKKIKCPKCKQEYLLSLKISDEKWRELDKDVRQARISRALAGEQLRDEVPKPPTPPAMPADALPKPTEHLQDEAIFKTDAPDEAILEARRLLEEKDVEAEMPAPQMDYKKFMIICVTSFVLLFIPAVLNILVPAITFKKELTAVSQAQPGESIKWGRHKGNTSWRVLEVDEDNDRVLVICDHKVKGDFPEKQSPPPGGALVSKDQIMIDWLNSSFMNSYFNVLERARIVPSTDDANKIFLIPNEQPNDGIYPAFWIRL